MPCCHAKEPKEKVRGRGREAPFAKFHFHTRLQVFPLSRLLVVVCNTLCSLEWVKEWWQVSHIVCSFCDYSPYYFSRWHQSAWNFDRYFLFKKLVPLLSLILTYSIRTLKILNIKHNLVVKYPQNISICGEYSQA